MNPTDLDVNTLFIVTMHVEIMLGLLLFFAWAQNFGKPALAWWGSAHMLRAVSIMLLGMHGSIPTWVSIDAANAVLFASFALTWSGARVFDRRSAEPVWCMVGVIIWMLACRLPQFAASLELRALIGSMERPGSPTTTAGSRSRPSVTAPTIRGTTERTPGMFRTNGSRPSGTGARRPSCSLVT